MNTLYLQLSDHFKELGATDAFDEGKADFSGIAPDRGGLCISNVFHKSFVEVNEEGSEAAAATAVVLKMKGGGRVVEQIHDFNCNRPFLFAIRDNEHKNILFFGKYAKPN